MHRDASIVVHETFFVEKWLKVPIYILDKIYYFGLPLRFAVAVLRVSDCLE